MLKAITPKRAALIVFAVTAATLVGAWIFEYFDYAPCELCLLQRWPYYVAIPFALILSLLAGAAPGLARAGLYGLALLLFGSAIIGAYHAGVEWKWWPGPTACTGGGGLTGLPDLSKPVVMCDEPALRIFGLSLAGWNALISIALANLALRGARS